MGEMVTQRRRTAWKLVSSVVAALALGGCYMEVAANYYPVVNGGPRVADTGWGFGINIGAGLKYKRVHAAFGRGYEVAAARYEDATGKGGVGHMSPYNVRVDVQAKRLVGNLWSDLTVGGSFGTGTAKAGYDDGVVANPNYMEPNITAKARSLFAGPTLHYDEGLEADYLLTLAPAMFESRSDAFDPFTAYGVTFRFVYQMGINPKPMQWGRGGLGNLFRSGRRSREEQQRQFEKDQDQFNRGQQEHKDRARERQEQERKERERECQQRRDC